MKEYAEILHALADGRRVQWHNPTKGWQDQDAKFTLSEIAASTYPPDHYRLAPSMVIINGHEVPEPMRTEPPGRARYWIVSLAAPELCFAAQWADREVDMRCLHLGICHLTREAAETHARALLSFTTKEDGL